MNRRSFFKYMSAFSALPFLSPGAVDTVWDKEKCIWKAKEGFDPNNLEVIKSGLRKKLAKYYNIHDYVKPDFITLQDEPDRLAGFTTMIYRGENIMNVIDSIFEMLKRRLNELGICKNDSLYIISGPDIFLDPCMNNGYYGWMRFSRIYERSNIV